MTTIDRTHIEGLLEKHAQLEQIDLENTQKILELLGLEGTCSLGDVLNSDLKEEREAAINIIRKNFDALTSDDEKLVEQTKETLGNFYYCVETSGIIEG